MFTHWPNHRCGHTSHGFRPRLEVLEGRALPSVTITVIAGTPQSAAVDTAFATPLQVQVENNGIPVGAGVDVTFSTPNINAFETALFPGSTPQNPITSVTVQTDAAGKATAPTLTAWVHAGEFTATAASAGAATPATFDLTDLPGPAAILKATAGTPQAATIGTAFSGTFQVAVEDVHQNRVGAGVYVTFTAPASGASGTFPGNSTTVSVPTDAAFNDVTAPTFTANGTAGSYTVTASVAGGATATFDLLNVNHDAVIDGPASGWSTVQLFIGSAGAPGSINFSENPSNGGWSSTLTQLTSFTFNAHSGAGTSTELNVGLPAGGPLLSGPIRLNAGASDSYLNIDVSHTGGGAPAAVVTRPGEVVVDGQRVQYDHANRIWFGSATAVDAATAPPYPVPANAYILHGYDYRGRPIPPSPSERFVQTLYLDTLGRAGTLAEVDSWAAMLGPAGDPTGVLAAAVQNSYDAREYLVKSWYHTYLGREAQNGEELGWANLLQTQSQAQVLGAMLGDPGGREFYNRAQTLVATGTPDERYVQALYQVLLGRPGSASDLSGWIALLPSLGTVGVARSFLQTPEYSNTMIRLDTPGGLQWAVAAAFETSFEARERLVQSWYQAYLGRPAQNGEEVGWANLLQSEPQEQVLAALLGNAGNEFYNRAQTLIPSGTPDERYVQALYQVLLGRTAGPSEVALWVATLPGAGRAGVAMDLVQTPEFRTDQFEGYFNALLHRSDDPSGLSGIVNSNQDVLGAKIAFESGADFYYNG